MKKMLLIVLSSVLGLILAAYLFLFFVYNGW